MQSLLRVLVFGSVLAILVPALSLTAQATDRAIGTWRLNIAKSTYDPGPLPKSLTLTFETAGQSVKVATKGVDTQGNATQTRYTASYDGKDYPVTGSPDYDTVALKRIDGSTVEATRKKGGKVVQTLTRVVSKDGKVLTTTTKGTDAKGRRINNVGVFEKQ